MSGSHLLQERCGERGYVILEALFCQADRLLGEHHAVRPKAGISGREEDMRR